MPALDDNSAAPTAVPQFEFLTDKYGDELLVDVGSTDELPDFAFHGSPHRLLFYDVLLLRRGHGRLLQEDRWHPVAPGSVVFLAPGEVRRWALSGDAEGLVLFFLAEFLRGFLRDERFVDELPFFSTGGPRVLPLSQNAASRLESQLLALQVEVQSRDWGRRWALEAGVYGVLVDLARRCRAERCADDSAGVSSADWLQELRAAIERDWWRHLPAEHYARACGVSPSHLRAKLRQATGRSLRQLLRDRVLLEAKRELLHSDRTVAEIAHHCGYDDPSHFGRVFRRETGCSPLDYRRAARGG